MAVMWLILPLALLIAAVAVVVFAWAVRSGQFDDLVTPGLRVLVDEDEDAAQEPSRPEQLTNDTR